MLTKEKLTFFMLTGPVISGQEALESILALHEKDANYLAKLSNIAGIACATDHIEPLRRAIYLVCREGPIELPEGLSYYQASREQLNYRKD